MIQTNLELKIKLLSQIAILGEERSLLPLSEAHIVQITFLVWLENGS